MPRGFFFFEQQPSIKNRHVGAGNSKRPSKEATLAQHSKARTKAEAQFKQVQKPQPRDGGGSIYSA